MTLRAALCLLVLSFCAPLALAVSPGVVEAVQVPAWRVRDDRIEPLQPGMDLRHGDQLRTGAGGRVYVKLAEGSRVKLGAGARFDFYSRSRRPERNFRGALDVLEGAFRYTTAQAAKLRRRELSVRVGTATIGIRGTDVWGRTTPEEDLVILIEGRVEVATPGREALVLDRPLTRFRADRSSGPEAPAPVDRDELARRAAETDLDPANGALLGRGRFSLRFGAALAEAEALALHDRLRDAGYPVRLRPVRKGGAWEFEVLLRGYPSRAAAQRAARKLEPALGLSVDVRA